MSHQNFSGGNFVVTSASDIPASAGVRSHLLATDVVVGNHRSPPKEIFTLQSERRFNIVISGVEECSKGGIKNSQVKA